MMFRIAPISLVVLAVMNVATSLASPVSSNASHRRLDYGFTVNFHVPPVPGHAFSQVKFDYTKFEPGYGCGADNQKCYCTTTADGALEMVGRGTTLSATGLAFSCTFVLDTNACSLYVYLEYYSPDNQIKCLCGANDENYEFTDCHIAQGVRSIDQTFHIKATNDLRSATLHNDTMLTPKNMGSVRNQHLTIA